MALKSLEAKVIDARARVAALQGDERADLPSSPERTAYNKALKSAVRFLKKWESLLDSPDYCPVASATRAGPAPTLAHSALGRSYNPYLTPVVAPPRIAKAAAPRPAKKVKRRQTKKRVRVAPVHRPRASAKNRIKAALRHQREEAMRATMRAKWIPNGGPETTSALARRARLLERRRKQIAIMESR